MDWFSVRNVYHFGTTETGDNIFEERVVCFKAKDFSDAHEKGKKESATYALENGFIAYDEQLVYKQDGEELIDCYEVWSELFQSPLDLDSFYREHYLKHLYVP
ncbi:DUF4288 domain-containing protein [Motiliproteus sp. MSK22-1]|uniref:DUF4288 domain-containing protein n=1 Tax=Motiliproteus sp. MSK22-1 TaxID=1897630 RepID=UPI0009783004|nr:DUF4288 domain-containing protein [Motiliproteus sp. MSK22-1]OMH38249.1 hypothetical protein BGP75_08345 [Motiliproteus sp. MSK22-1]